MPKLDDNFNQVQESTASSEFKRMEPGVYECIITAIDTEWETRNGLQKAEDRKCVRVQVDVADGDFAGEFSREFYEDKPYAHSLFMSWSDKALGMLKHTFNAIDEANNCFDSRAAFEADKWTLFIGKKCLIAWNGTERTNDRGYTNVNVKPDRFVTASDNPRIKVETDDGRKVSWDDYKEMQDSDSAPKNSTAGVSTYDDESIPF